MQVVDWPIRDRTGEWRDSPTGQDLVIGLVLQGIWIFPVFYLFYVTSVVFCLKSLIVPRLWIPPRKF